MPVLCTWEEHTIPNPNIISLDRCQSSVLEKNIPYQTPTCHLLTDASPLYLRRTYHIRPQHAISWQEPVPTQLERNLPHTPVSNMSLVTPSAGRVLVLNLLRRTYHTRPQHAISWQVPVLNLIEKNIPYLSPTCHLLTGASPQPNWEEHTIPVPNMPSLDRCQSST